MPNLSKIDFSGVKETFLDVFNKLSLPEEEFFDLIRRYPDINKLDDLITVIQTEDNSKEKVIYPEIIELFEKYYGLVDSNILKENQVSYYHIKKLEEMGKIVKLKRGLYALRDTHYVVEEIVEASFFVPKGVICLYSALVHYELTTFTPSEHNFAVSRKDRKPALPNYPPIRLFSYDDDTFDIGVEKIEKEGHVIKIYDLERTICDVVKYRNKLDANVVKESLNTYFARRNTNYTKLLKYAAKMRIKTILNNYLEVL
ncbi:Abortive infection protein AbiEi [Paenibacillus oryzisoli]|uniref:type IV toxin-antitoxin system AbiEi family antitoxin domain-containing protein n=1 Tax=Paenibacillus oryzisoli TaxID=1850517 RepID=UPI003D2A95E7